jgi:hypothetical protein
MMFQWTAAIAFGSATLIPIAHAGPCLNVGVHFTTSNRTGPDNVITDLMDTGSFESIEFIDASHFRADNDNDALFIAWGKSPDAVNEPNRVLYGERLADYISTGGSVVITQRGISENIGPGADFRNEFLPLLAESACPYGIEGTSPITFPGEDPIFSEVHILNVGFYSEVSCNGGTIREGAQLHASLPDGRPFVVSDGPVVAINSYFVSDDSVAPDSIYGYPAGSDYPQLFANALYFAAGFDASTACNGDYDDDGLSDEDEATLGTDFQRADSDADGTNDGIDNCPSLATPTSETSIMTALAMPAPTIRRQIPTKTATLTPTTTAQLRTTQTKRTLTVTAPETPVNQNRNQSHNKTPTKTVSQMTSTTAQPSSILPKTMKTTTVLAISATTIPLSAVPQPRLDLPGPYFSYVFPS